MSMKPLRTFLVVYPLALPLAFFATWLAGRWSLGHWPQPSLDDPKTIGLWVDVPYAVTQLLLFVGLPLFLVCAVALIAESWRDKPRLASAQWKSAAALAFMLASLAVLRWDPLRMVEWFAD